MSARGERILFIGRNTRYAITTRAFLRLQGGLRDTSHVIAGVVHTHEDDLHSPNSLRRLARDHGVESVSFVRNDVNAPSSLDALEAFEATIFLVVQYPKIFDRAIISVPAKACLNVHRGWPLRGGSIDQRAIYYKQKEYFLILHEIDAGIDTGDILARESVALDWRTDTGHSLDARATAAVERLIDRGFLPRLENGDFNGEKQKRSETRYEGKWAPDRKVVSAREVDHDDAERLARALHHPREESLVVEIGGDLYRWDCSGESEPLRIEWRDRIQAAPLARM